MKSQTKPAVSLPLLSYKTLENLSTVYGDSFYLYNDDLFKSNLINFRTSFQNYYPNTSIGYSFKTNYLPRICITAREAGAYAEVVSGMEYDLALRTGYNPTQILFNGPYKKVPELHKAFEMQSIVHFESYEEIEYMKYYLRTNPQKTVKCAVRCNFDIGEETPSRFGFDADNEDVVNIYNDLFSVDRCEPIGLHCHFSTKHRSTISFELRVNRLANIAKSVFLNKNLSYIDIGGGFFGDIPQSLRSVFSGKIPDLNDYGKIVGEEMIRQFPGNNIKLILEPGAAVAANVMNFVCKVTSVKRIGGKKFATISGSIHNVRPNSSGKTIPFSVISKSGSERTDKSEKSVIGGYTCMEDDIIDASYEGNLSVGDYLIFPNTGAYTIVFKPPFIRESPPVLMMSNKDQNNHYTLIKHKETLDDIFSSYIF